MKKLFLIFVIIHCVLFTISAQTKTSVTEFNLAGPYPVAAPLAFDTVNVKGEKFDDKLFLNTMPSFIGCNKSIQWEKCFPSLEDSKSVGLLSFYINNVDYLKGKIKVNGPKSYKLFIDGQEASSDLNLAS